MLSRYQYDAQSLRYAANANRLSALNGTSISYDASGQRTIKINADGSSHIFSYNQQGQLLFEGRYNAAKQLHSQRHYIWLNDTPVGFVQKDNISNNNSDNNNRDWNIYAIHTDHLNTPRLVTNQDGAEMWRWASDAFGESAAVGSIEFNLRFPGQYYDGESGLHYNYFRDYNAQTGRYVQSDPIGLAGGLNTYVYVNANPINYVDPLGLFSICNLLSKLPFTVNLSVTTGAGLAGQGGLSLSPSGISGDVTIGIGGGLSGHASIGAVTSASEI